MVVDVQVILERLHRLDEDGLDDLTAFIVYITDFLKEEGYLQRE